MLYLAGKYLISAALVVLISELVRHESRAAALLTAIPVIAVLSLIWQHQQGQSLTQIADYSRQTFWYVLPTLPMFLALPLLLPRLGFWPALLTCLLITAAGMALLHALKLIN